MRKSSISGLRRSDGHLGRLLPGKVHRIFHKTLIAEPEIEIHRPLGYLGLLFERVRFQFYRTDRVVAAVSSRPVRSPTYRDAPEQSRHFEPRPSSLIKILDRVLIACLSLSQELRRDNGSVPRMPPGS
jgi:hypothetical protein